MTPAPAPFERFVGIDWSGAKGERHRSISVAVAEAGSTAPVLLTPERPWSRAEVFALIQGFADRRERVLIGIDMCFGMPFVDRGGYFPGDDAAPGDARSLWREVADVAADDPHHAAHAYVEHRRAHFWLGAADGPRHSFARLRSVEQLDKARGNVPSSPMVLLGPSQCGKASLAGMRLLAELGDLPIWPFDPPPDEGPLLVEAYCRLYAQLGGARGKLRSRAVLDAALAGLGSEPCGAAIPAIISDHDGDALVTAAGLRFIAGDPHYWNPPDLTPEIAATEGWTFGMS